VIHLNASAGIPGQRRLSIRQSVVGSRSSGRDSCARLWDICGDGAKRNRRFPFATTRQASRTRLSALPAMVRGSRDDSGIAPWDQEPCSADFQSAVSRVFNPQAPSIPSARQPERARANQRPATESRRYGRLRKPALRRLQFVESAQLRDERRRMASTTSSALSPLIAAESMGHSRRKHGAHGRGLGESDDADRRGVRERSTR